MIMYKYLSNSFFLEKSWESRKLYVYA